MKTLYIVRHAKSSWGDMTLPDFERPLNERGKNDAPEMAARLLKRKANIDVFISSTAKRALKTCKLFCKVYKNDKENIICLDELYHASPKSFYKVIQSIDDRFDTVAIFSHNPGITDFVNEIQQEVRIDNMPTCAIFAINSPVKNWKEFSSVGNSFQFFDYPKLNTT